MSAPAISAPLQDLYRRPYRTLGNEIRPAFVPPCPRKLSPPSASPRPGAETATYLPRGSTQLSRRSHQGKPTPRGGTLIPGPVREARNPCTRLSATPLPPAITTPPRPVSCRARCYPAGDHGRGWPEHSADVRVRVRQRLGAG